MSEDQENEPSIEEILDSIRQIISEEDEDEAQGEPAAEEAVAAETVADVNSATDETASADDIDAIMAAMDAAPAVDETAVDEVPTVDVVAADDADLADDDIFELTEVAGEDSEADDFAAVLDEVATQDDVSEPVADVVDVEEEIAVEAAPEAEAVPEVDVTSEVEVTPEPVSASASSEMPSSEPIVQAMEENVISSATESVTASAFATLAKKAAVDRSGLVSLEDIVREEVRPILRTWVDDHLPAMLERLLQEELDKIAKRVIED